MKDKDLYLMLGNNDTWSNMPFKSLFLRMGQKELISKVFDMEKETYSGEIDLTFNGNKWNLKISGFDNKLKQIIADLGDELGGYYDNDNTIYLNYKFCIKNHSRDHKNNFSNENRGYGKGMYRYMTHELHHAFQKHLFENKDKYLKQVSDNSEFGKYLNQIGAYMFGHKSQINYLNYNFTGNLHINPYTPKTENSKLLEDISHMLYYLNIVEFEAFKVSEEKTSNLNNEGIKMMINGDTMDAVSFFEGRYDCYINNIEEVVSIISDCILKLHNNEPPRSDLEASIMYDICCMAYLEEIDISDSERLKREEQCTNWLMCNIKEELLQQYSLNEDNNKKKIYSIDEFSRFLLQDNPLSELTSEIKRNNPELVLYLASVKSDGDIDYSTFSDDTLKEYCNRRKHSLYDNEKFRDGAKTIFGENFWKDLGIEQDNTIQEQAEHSETTEYSISHTLNINQDEEEIDIQ